MTANMPRPPQRQPQSVGPNWLRAGGIITALSAPISGFVLYAVVAVLVGEDRLEGDGGLTALGLLPFVVPLVLGVALFGLSFTGHTGPSRRVTGFVVGAVALGLAGLGLLALADTNTGDASIGGGLLIIAAVILAGLAILLLRRSAPAEVNQSPKL